MNSGYDGSLPEALGGIFTFIWWYFHFYFHFMVFSLSSHRHQCVSMPGKKTTGGARRGLGLVDAVVGWRDLASSLVGNHPKVLRLNVLFWKISQRQ